MNRTFDVSGSRRLSRGCRWPGWEGLEGARTGLGGLGG